MNNEYISLNILTKIIYSFGYFFVMGIVVLILGIKHVLY